MNGPKRIKLDVIGTHTKMQPVLSDELIMEIPLIEAYIDTIKNRKDISRVVVELNRISPMPDLIHLKRVHGNDILLFAVNEKNAPSSETVHAFLKGKGFNVELLENNVRKIHVAGQQPKIRQQYDIVHKLWPCNFHSNQYLEKLVTNTLFSNAELNEHALFMLIAINVAKINQSKFGVVVVDPKINSVVAVGYNQTDHYLYKHAVMVAVENVAKTQRKTEYNDDDDDDDDDDIVTNPGIPSHILNCIKENFEGVKFGERQEFVDDGPYLCTGYSIYVTHEPCIACAMALIHSRAKRVFYGRKHPAGALGSLCKIHVIKSLNHHFEAFAGLLEDECGTL